MEREPYTYQTEEPHFDNSATLSDWLYSHMPEGWEIVDRDGTYAEVRDEERRLYAVQASGNGDSQNHKIEFELLEDPLPVRRFVGAKGNGAKIEYVKQRGSKHPSERDPDTAIFSVIRWQGRDPETDQCLESGHNGVSAMLEIREGCDEVLRYAIKYHPDWAKAAIGVYRSAVREPGWLDHVDASEDLSETGCVSGVFFKYPDGIRVSYNKPRLTRQQWLAERNSPDAGKLKPEHLKLSLEKWQGDCQLGEEGLQRLNILRDNIDYVLAFVRREFPGLVEFVEKGRQQQLAGEGESLGPM
ncbi:hypothetical protein [Ferrimonas marina]|uniref:Uncharacterized protein n=1 Tax=Ferrimonas marina TaxID=299255 RepID=A0A1M5U1G5_9GAMM|nr:hypothetical protein [Ferrimonas marina]SHH56804.1 hypothetical protein SAMN02745129_2366 [Ferrimonas marina]